ncbi:MAG: hypothetical protein AB3N16_06375 [Flavobacteriaceae bacterium]
MGLLWCVPLLGVPQEGQPVSQHEIPFTLTGHNNIAVDMVLNKVDTLTLMFHTAADAISIIDTVANTLKSIHWNNLNEVESWGGKENARSSTGNSVQIENMEWDRLTIWDCKHSGPRTEGKFGLHLFQGKTVEIDYDRKRIVLRDSLPPNMENYRQFELTHNNGLMFIQGISIIGEHSFPNRYLLHSGYAGTLLYDDAFVAANQLGSRLQVVDEKALKDSYGNVIHVKKATLPIFTLGNVVLKDVPVGFFEGAIGKQRMSVMGGDVLKRFNIVMDSQRKYVYLKPNSLMPLPYSLK